VCRPSQTRGLLAAQRTTIPHPQIPAIFGSLGNSGNRPIPSLSIPRSKGLTRCIPRESPFPDLGDHVAITCDSGDWLLCGHPSLFIPRSKGLTRFIAREPLFQNCHSDRREESAFLDLDDPPRTYAMHPNRVDLWSAAALGCGFCLRFPITRCPDHQITGLHPCGETRN
jgi:hypothetical protein